MSNLRTYLIAALLFAGTTVAVAADNQLTGDEKAAGWRLLFNGKDYTGWRCNNGRKIASPIDQDALMPHGSGGYLIVYDKQQFGDFVLKCDVKMDAKCNSGVFIRVGNLLNPVYSGIEVQVASEIGTGYHDFAALYDLVGPKHAPHLKPDWNSLEITGQGPRISVAVNGETLTKMNCDEWPVAHKSPDGHVNKFHPAIKDFPRKGYIGFQDHGHKVWYKNVKIRELQSS